MKNFYELLGVNANASETQIKNAYRKLARDNHPDRGGDAIKMGLLNEAYDMLSDPDKRKTFDDIWATYHATNIDESSQIMLADYLSSGNLRPYSYEYRQEHAQMINLYTSTPLNLNTTSTPDSIFAPEYSSMSSIDTLLTLPINNSIATKLLIACLSGGYHDEPRLKNIKQYLTTQYNIIHAHIPKAPELKYYESIKEILFMLPKPAQEQRELIFSIKKITDYTKQLSEDLLINVLPLFYNKFFRQLYAHALHLHWHAEEYLSYNNPRHIFDGHEETKDLLNVLRDRLANESEPSTSLNSIVQDFNLLYRFEKDLHDAQKEAKNAADYREMAFHTLDWFSVFKDRNATYLKLNLFLQIGVLLQHASRLETSPIIQMADEQLALKLYLTAMMLAKHATPDAEIYVNNQILQRLSSFKFATLIQIEYIEALKKNTLTIIDIFPFFESAKPNVAWMHQENRSLHLMRQLLNTMLQAYEYNKIHQEQIKIDHLASDLLYQAYEACLKNWYQKEYDLETEKKFRLDLMEELLLDHAWNDFDVEKLLESPWIMVDRDEEGWLRPTRALPFDDDPRCIQYKSIHGMEINHKNGDIQFFMTPWSNERPIYEKTFTLFDLQDMLARNLGQAIFSLDPVDPNKPYHPFNLMRFNPAQLFESELLNTMLLTDYVLKFLTTNQEVQGRYPFGERSVMEMIQHVPEYLQDIIKNYQNSDHLGALHRFWIEAETIDVAFKEPANDDDCTRISVDNIKMVVKKHCMQRDVHGELKDTDNDDEGWPMYIVREREVRRIEEKLRILPGRAMLFVEGQNKVCFWNNDEIIKTHQPQDYIEPLIRLFKQPRDTDGKIQVSTKNMPLIYRVTLKMTEQAEQHHHFSPEFIFAHEFTTRL